MSASLIELSITVIAATRASHLHSPGQANINGYLGRAGYYGTNSQRVNQTILGHVSTRSCLPDPVSQTEIFADGFESGSTSAWGS